MARPTRSIWSSTRTAPAPRKAHHPPILVLSRDPNLVETVKKAAPRGTAVAPAPDLDHVAGKLSDLKPGVLVADTASTADVAAMVAQLTQHFPELVVIVAGKREDSAALMQLTATGRIFRFLLTPLSHGQTRLALEAAVTQHQDLLAQGQRLSAASGTTGGDNKNYVMTYGALAAGLLIVIGGIWFGVNKFTGEPTPPPVVQQQTPAGQPGGVPEKIDPVQAELGLAKEAFAQGKYLEPAGDSALDYYRSALALDPNSAAAKEGIRDVVDKILERAEQSLTSEKLEDASRNIELARDIDPAHPRLSFLDTQMARERERIKLSQAADVANRVKALVNTANDRMQNGRLVTPANASARDALMEARRLDATDPNVVQSVRDFAALLTEEARKSVAEGDIAEAQNYVNIVRQMGSAGAALAAVERQLADANRAAAAATQQRRATALDLRERSARRRHPSAHHRRQADRSAGRQRARPAGQPAQHRADASRGRRAVEAADDAPAGVRQGRDVRQGVPARGTADRRCPRRGCALQRSLRSRRPRRTWRPRAKRTRWRRTSCPRTR